MFPIKWASFLLIFFSLNLYARKKNQLSYIIEVKKKSKLFDRPSANGIVIGHAEEGMNLIFLEESIKGLWVKAQDSDGDVGWLPKDRTDFADIKQSLESVHSSKNIEKKEKKEINDEILNKDQNSNFEANYRLSTLYRILGNDRNFSSLLGIRFDLKTGYFGFRGARDKFYSLSLEGALPSQFHKISDGYEGAIRFSMKTPFYQKSFYGSDYGYSFQNRNSSFNHHLSLGLFGGLNLGRVDARIRTGYDFFSNSHATIEVQLGCWF
jgi:hypothetical protein